MLSINAFAKKQSTTYITVQQNKITEITKHKKFARELTERKEIERSEELQGASLFFKKLELGELTKKDLLQYFTLKGTLDTSADARFTNKHNFFIEIRDVDLYLMKRIVTEGHLRNLPPEIIAKLPESALMLEPQTCFHLLRYYQLERETIFGLIKSKSYYANINDSISYLMCSNFDARYVKFIDFISNDMPISNLFREGVISSYVNKHFFGNKYTAYRTWNSPPPADYSEGPKFMDKHIDMAFLETLAIKEAPESAVELLDGKKRFTLGELNSLPWPRKAEAVEIGSVTAVEPKTIFIKDGEGLENGVHALFKAFSNIKLKKNYIKSMFVDNGWKNGQIINLILIYDVDIKEVHEYMGSLQFEKQIKLNLAQKFKDDPQLMAQLDFIKVCPVYKMQHVQPFTQESPSTNALLIAIGSEDLDSNQYLDITLWLS